MTNYQYRFILMKENHTAMFDLVLKHETSILTAVSSFEGYVTE